jgi:hypothetical protein
MQVMIDPKELAPVIQATIAATLAQIQADETRIGDRLAIPEPEAARLLSLEPHQLRDERRRGRIAASVIVGKRIRYSRADLLEYLATRRIVAQPMTLPGGGAAG